MRDDVYVSLISVGNNAGAQVDIGRRCQFLQSKTVSTLNKQMVVDYCLQLLTFLSRDEIINPFNPAAINT